MLDSALAARPAVSLAPGRRGRAAGPPGLTIQERAGRTIVGIAARRGREADLVEAVRGRWGVVLPTTPRVVDSGMVSFAWAGSGQWLAHAPAEAGLEAALRSALDGLAALVAQGDGRVVLLLGGGGVRTVLATLVPVDLHPRSFGPGDTAITLAGHVGIHLRQLDEAPTFELTAFRSFADHLCECLLDAGRAQGAVLLDPG